MKQEHWSLERFRQELAKPNSAKYHNKKTLCDGRLFHSQGEANYYCELKLMKRSGKILDFFCQYDLLIEDGYYKNEGTPQQVWVKPVFYRADFLVIPKVIFYMAPVKEEWKIEIHEFKGFWTDEAQLKFRKAVARYPEYEFKVIK